MFRMREWISPAVEPAAAPPSCPNCGRPMQLDGVTFRTRDLSDLTFTCAECWVTEEETDERR